MSTVLSSSLCVLALRVPIDQHHLEQAIGIME
jgi:hypothetical protein